MRAQMSARPTEYLLVPVPEPASRGGLPLRRTAGVEDLVAAHAVDGWVLVTLRAGRPSAQALFRRPLLPRSAA